VLTQVARNCLPRGKVSEAAFTTEFPQAVNRTAKVVTSGVFSHWDVLCLNPSILVKRGEFLWSPMLPDELLLASWLMDQGATEEMGIRSTQGRMFGKRKDHSSLSAKRAICGYA
jgi:hypothetical protein